VIRLIITAILYLLESKFHHHGVFANDIWNTPAASVRLPTQCAVAWRSYALQCSINVLLGMTLNAPRGRCTVINTMLSIARSTNATGLLRPNTGGPTERQCTQALPGKMSIRRHGDTPNARTVSKTDGLTEMYNTLVQKLLRSYAKWHSSEKCPQHNSNN